MKINKARIEQADGSGGTNYHRYLKRAKVRSERRRAKIDPECAPSYRKFSGYEL